MLSTLWTLHMSLNKYGITMGQIVLGWDVSRKPTFKHVEEVRKGSHQFYAPHWLSFNASQSVQRQT